MRAVIWTHPESERESSKCFLSFKNAAHNITSLAAQSTLNNPLIPFFKISDLDIQRSFPCDWAFGSGVLISVDNDSVNFAMNFSSCLLCFRQIHFLRTQACNSSSHTGMANLRKWIKWIISSPSDTLSLHKTSPVHN